MNSLLLMGPFGKYTVKGFHHFFGFVIFRFGVDVHCNLMEISGKAYFVSDPRRIEDLTVLHLVEKERPYKDIKQVVADLKKVYTAVTLEEAEANLETFAAKWRKQYPSCVKSWEENWEVLSTFFEYPQEIRKIIYTTNIPADHQEKAIVHQRRFSAPDAVSGVTEHCEALACPVSELGHGPQPVGDHVRRPKGWLVPLG